MSLIFKSGSSPNYSGETFNNGNEILTSLRDWLVSAGWTVRDDFITETSLLVMEGKSENLDSCFFRFTIQDQVGVLNGKLLTIQGDIDGSNSSLSPQFNFNFIENTTNIVYLTADSGSFCLLIESYDLILNSGHFGFLDQPDASLDPFGWMIGTIDWKVTNSYWAKSFRENINWHSVGEDYWLADVFNDQRNQVLYAGIWDRYSVGVIESLNNYSGNAGGFENDRNTNTGYYSYKGAISPITQLPLLGEYYYLEGRGYNNYGNSYADLNPPPLAFRGTVRHCVVGMASLPAKMQVTDKAGNRYISTGGFGYQGFRIA